MFTKLSNSWELVKASWTVLLADKELLIFPVVSFIASLVVIATFAVPTILADVFDGVTGLPVAGYVIGFSFYVVMYCVTIFSNSALVGAAMIRLEGGDPTVRDGFRIATKHLGSILGYAAISATVGVILRAISERGGIIGQIVSSLVGFAWGVATFLVVPVLVVEGVGPMEGVKRSANLLKRTWGEQIVGNFGIGTVFGLLFFVVIFVGIGAIALAAVSGSVALIVTMVFLVLAAIMLLAMLNGALSGIYTAAVYRYATTGETAVGFDPNIIKNTFKQK
ncbi:MAG: hypothetical protein H6658_05400 [Ardenticatenaceae bacterium]|nr:hypothetical protein [Ardenticatenaceae bacterium]